MVSLRVTCLLWRGPNRPPLQGETFTEFFPGCRVEIWRGGSGAPFPDPAHQTGRAVFPHPAFGQGL